MVGADASDAEHRYAYVRSLFLFILFLLPVLVILPSANAVEDEPDVYPEGDTAWELPAVHRLFLNGVDETSANLTRSRPSSTTPTGTAQVGYTGFSGPQVALTADAQAATQSVNVSMNISAFFHVTLIAPAETYCRQTGWPPPIVDKSTQVGVNILVDGQTILSGESEWKVIDSVSQAAPINFTIEKQETNLTILEHEVLTLEVWVDHLCENTQAQINWGSFGSSSGIVFHGDLIQPVVTASVDSLHFAYVEMLPMSPWGGADITKNQMAIYGPIYPDEYDTNDMDIVVDSFEAPVGMRKVEGNSTAYTWVTTHPLDSGHHLAKFCLQVIDGNTLDHCHIEGRYRFIVPAEEGELFNAVIWLGGLSLLMLLSWLGYSLKQGLFYPPPMIGSFFMMLLLMIPVHMGLPALNEEYDAREDGTVTAFNLITHGNGSTSASLDNLLAGNDAVIIGVFQPGSPNALDQANVFNDIMDNNDGIAFAQLATGKDVQMIDVEEHAAYLNGSWPLMIDEPNAAIASQFPTGASDGVVIIDKANTITWWRAGTASQKDMLEAVDGIESGGQQSITSVFTILWTSAFALLFIALPRSELEEPEEPLPPGSHWGGMMLGGVAGFAVFAVPLAIISIALGAGELWLWLQAVLGLWLLIQGCMTAWKGHTPEVSLIAALVHKLLPSGYSDWREVYDLRTDVQLGMWVAWLTWLTSPMLIPQGIGATMQSGMWGLVIGLAWSLGLIICVGLVVLVLRLVASWGGPISRVFGKLGQPEFSRIFGLYMAPIGVWMLIQGLLQVNAVGLI